MFKSDDQSLYSEDPVGSFRYGARANFLHRWKECNTYSVDPIGPSNADGFTWTIENASLCPQDGVTSPKVAIGNAEYSLQLIPERRCYFNCRLIRDGSAEPIAYRIALLTTDNTFFDTVSGILDFRDTSPIYTIHMIEFSEAGFLFSPCDVLVLQCYLWKPRRLVLTGLSAVTNILTVTQVLYKNYLFDLPKAPAQCKCKDTGCTHTPAAQCECRVRDCTHARKDRLTFRDFDFFYEDDSEFESYVDIGFFEPMVEKDDQLYQWIRIRYRTTGKWNSSACMRARISVLDVKGKVWKSSDKFTQWVNTEDTSMRTLPNFLRHWEIAQARKRLVREDGSVRFKYEAEISFGGICNSIENRSYDCARRAPGCTLPQDILRVFLKQKYCDLTVRWLGQSFFLHRCIVCYRSSFIKRCYDARVKKNETNAEDICMDDELKDLDQLPRLLRFIYSGAVDDKWMDLKEFQAFQKSARKLKMCPLTCTKKENPLAKCSKSDEKSRQ